MIVSNTCENAQQLIFIPAIGENKPILKISCSFCQKEVCLVIDKKVTISCEDSVLQESYELLALKWSKIHQNGIHQFCGMLFRKYK